MGCAAWVLVCSRLQAPALHLSTPITLVAYTDLVNVSLRALIVCLTNAPPSKSSAGVDDEGLKVKQSVVQAALHTNRDLIQQGPLQALQAVGGVELAAMTAAYLQAAQRGMPVVADGYISCAAALVACRHDPERARRCLFVSHQMVEAGHCGAQQLMQELGCGRPMLNLGFRLGEGTGAVLAVPLLKSAAALMRDMAALKDVLAG